MLLLGCGSLLDTTGGWGPFLSGHDVRRSTSFCRDTSYLSEQPRVPCAGGSNMTSASKNAVTRVTNTGTKVAITRTTLGRGGCTAHPSTPWKARTEAKACSRGPRPAPRSRHRLGWRCVPLRRISRLYRAPVGCIFIYLYRVAVAIPLHHNPKGSSTEILEMFSWLIAAPPPPPHPRNRLPTPTSRAPAWSSQT